MSFDSLIAASLRLSMSVETFAALGAELVLRRHGPDGDPRLRTHLQDVVRTIDPHLLESLDDNDEANALALIRAVFRQAMDLLENPGRDVGWTYRDAEVLESQGQISRLIVQGIETIAGRRPALDTILRQPGTLIDVGTGAGCLAIEAARVWPALQVIGIDPWEPALELARRKISTSDVAERIELRQQRVEQLEDASSYTLAWIPGPFIGADIVDRALQRIYRALAPGGWLIFGLNAPPRNSAEHVLSSLRVVRWGGHPWMPQEVMERMRTLDFEAVEVFSPRGPILLVVGRRAE